MLAWLFSVFVMTPFAAIQTLLSVFLIYGICTIGEEYSLMIVGVCLVLLLIVNKIVRLIRFGRDTSVMYIFLDLLTAPLRLPLILATNLLAFIGIFNGLEIDARNEPYLDHDGFWGCVALYLLHISPGYRAKKTLTLEEARKRYKVKNAFYQFGALLLTFIHSFSGIVILNDIFPLTISEPGYSDYNIYWHIGYILVYMATAMLSAKMKGITTTIEYYDPRKIEEVEYEQELWYDESVREIKPYGDPVEVKRKTIQEPGMKKTDTLQMMLYFFFGMFAFYNQVLVFLLSLIIPQKAKYHPCMAHHCPGTFGAKLLYFFFGIAKC